MSFKKGLLALALSSLSLSAFATTEITVWEDVNKTDGIAIAAAEFEQEYDAKVNIVELDYVKGLSKLKEVGPNGNGPDVLLIPGDQLGAAVNADLLAPMALATGDNINDYIKDALQTLTFNGKIYGYPKSIETIILYYNKDKLARPLHTLEDYYNFSKEQRAKGEYGLIAKFDQLYFSFGSLYAYGGYIFNRDDTGAFDVNDVGLANQGAVEAVSYLKKFFKDDVIPAEILNDDGVQVMDKLFMEQKAAAVINGPWAADSYTKAGVNYEVAPLPMMPNGENMSSLLGVRGYVISKWSKNKELAEKFLQYINQPQYATIRFEKISEIPALNSLISMPIIIRNKTANTVTTQSIRSVPMPSVPEIDLVWNDYDAALEPALTGQKDVKEALEGAVKIIQKKIDNYRFGNKVD